MAYTYIPDEIFIVVYLSALLSAVGLYAYVSTLIFRNVRQMKQTPIAFIAYVFATIVLVSFLVHGALSGLYHDANGTGPSDTEQNFHLIQLILTGVLAAISYFDLKRK